MRTEEGKEVCKTTRRCEIKEKSRGRDTEGLNLEGWRVTGKYRQKQQGREFGIPEKSLENKEPK